MSKATTWTSVQRVCRVLVDNVQDFIKWPRNDVARIEQQKWQRMSGFPGVVGAIDGCLIPISTPLKHQESYVCRKKFHAISLQGVCDSDKKFIDVDVGSVHDARAFRNSDLKDNINEDQNAMFPDNGHMLGDSAYPCLEYLMIPYKDNGHLSTAQNKFNKKLSKSRVVIEQTFGLLVSRFRRLKFIYMRRTDLIPLVIMAACIMHNICIDNNDEIVVEENVTFNDNITPVNNSQEIIGNSTGAEKRTRLVMEFVTEQQ